MDPTLQTFVQQLLNFNSATTLEQKLGYLRLAREYVSLYSPPIDAMCLSPIFNLQVFSHFALFEELLLLIEAILRIIPTVDLFLPAIDFIERIGFGCSDDWLISVLHFCGRVFSTMLPHILKGRETPLSSLWRLCWQKISCLAQSLGVKALTSATLNLQITGVGFMEIIILLYTDPAVVSTAGGRPGAPTTDMLLYNTRYLIDQLIEQLLIDNQSRRLMISLIQSLAKIVSERHQYFDSIVPSLLSLADRSQYKIINISVTDEDSAQVSLQLRESLMALKNGRQGTRQKAMLLLGLASLGRKEESISYSHDTPSDTFGVQQTWTSDAAESPHFKRQKIDPREINSSSHGSSGVNKTVLAERVKEDFQRRLSVPDLLSIFATLKKQGNGDCVKLVVDQLSPDLVRNLVLYNLNHSEILYCGAKEDGKDCKKAESKVKPSSSLAEIHRPDAFSPSGSFRIEPLTMSLGEKQMLIEFSSSQLISSECKVGDLPLGMHFLTKLASRNPQSNIPFHLFIESISQKLQTSPDEIHNLCVEFLFNLFVSHGTSGVNVGDISEFVEKMESFKESTLDHPYDQALFRILNKIRTSEVEGRDKLLKGLLMEAPVLPPPVVYDFFSRMLTENSAATTSFLITANALMESQPTLKPVLLETVLQTCVSEDSDTREKAIRLVKNKLHQDDQMAERIERCAYANLTKLTPTSETVEPSDRYCQLYLALCTRKPSLLQSLLETFSVASEDGKRIIMCNAKQLSEAAHFMLPEMLQLLKQIPDGSAPLLLQLLSVFPDNSPPQAAVDACIEQYNATRNVRFLLPIMPGLSKTRVMETIPLLTQLPLEEFASALRDLVGHLPFGDSIAQPSEILVALGSSTGSDSQGNTEGLGSIKTALDYCIKQMGNVFDKEVLAGALNKLVHLHTLPVLFMRMVLLSISREKDLGTFVLQSILSASVISTKIRSEPAQWQGYLLLLQKTIPSSFRHLLSLPVKLMSSALREMPRNFVEKLMEFVESDACDVRVDKEAVSAIKELCENLDLVGDKAEDGSSAQHQKSGD